ncbi:NAD-dependent epimerase/dehydratase family protein [Sphingomonas ginkgonis]|uniref:NAD-dependent epimerase/dehydratase family protein n=1 Tax=Sphingomonas ginkgonis TaxID=2315330 RepID=A0A429V8W4_9SPHN|nr:GDP-mannose 4,6-dehydratase [Sphingomonas ginkgonis]RST30378.1 NAD-dependent epimerase/dehydratase family protein [Sphingomonas ginkgonis]
MPRTLVTGAAGFTGRYLTALLASRDHEVHGLVHHRPDEAVEGLFACHEGDIADPQAMERVVEAVRPDHVVHLAAIAFVAHHDVSEMYRANIVGTRQLLDALARAGQPPRSVLVASSANVYGNSQAGVLDETLPPNPANDYGITKVAVEALAHLYGDRLKITVVRPFNYTGRGQSADFLIPKIVGQVRAGASEIALGNLDVARDFSDVRGVVDAYARLLECEGAAGKTFNVCSGVAIPLGEVLERIRAISGHSFSVTVNPAFVRPDEVRTLRGTAAKLEAAIGPLAMPAFDDTLRWMLAD